MIDKNICIWILLILSTMNISLSACRLERFSGHIIAYRSDKIYVIRSDILVVRIVEGIVNRKEILIKTDNPKASIVKVIYEHFGDMKDANKIDSVHIIKLTVDRDESCDETYGEFIYKSRRPDGIPYVGLPEPIQYIGDYNENSYPEHLLMKCYKVKGDKIKIKAQNF